MLGMWDRGPHVNPIASDLGDSDGEYIRGIRGYTQKVYPATCALGYTSTYKIQYIKLSNGDGD